MEGSVAAEPLIERLEALFRDNEAFIVAARHEREERSMNQFIREEQDRAFQETLRQDQVLPRFQLRTFHYVVIFFLNNQAVRGVTKCEVFINLLIQPKIPFQEKERKKKEEEEQKKREEEEQLRLEKEETERKEEIERMKVELASEIPNEPDAGEADCVRVLVKLPGGQVRIFLPCYEL